MSRAYGQQARDSVPQAWYVVTIEYEQSILYNSSSMFQLPPHVDRIKNLVVAGFTSPSA
jgi:hypothetical protein